MYSCTPTNSKSTFYCPLPIVQSSAQTTQNLNARTTSPSNDFATFNFKNLRLQLKRANKEVKIVGLVSPTECTSSSAFSSLPPPQLLPIRLPSVSITNSFSPRPPHPVHTFQATCNTTLS
ncbi:hypothetical protein PtA15_10A150 [Puccinia triticina]|uniref:Uncharacterized protein n=1 Tax=Puccinia triticina TaxID=208348 RepID=A0ABY7CTV5_9BASI|nr:uncharacterized protein PtA15_10A150 [Puccinia triticina]WAQ88731.1 hypothetical protein PtA15_10A150 [Puccinia triticina]WAR58797.1 hypothetical protein PtB15_10B136 [Puccinia triticina]